MEFHVIPWRNHMKVHGGITQGIETRQWNHAMEFHAEFHGQHRVERIVRRLPCDGMEPITIDGTDHLAASISSNNYTYT